MAIEKHLVIYFNEAYSYMDNPLVGITTKQPLGLVAQLPNPTNLKRIKFSRLVSGYCEIDEQSHFS